MSHDVVIEKVFNEYSKLRVKLNTDFITIEQELGVGLSVDVIVLSWEEWRWLVNIVNEYLAKKQKKSKN